MLHRAPARSELSSLSSGWPGCSDILRIVRAGQCGGDEGLRDGKLKPKLRWERAAGRPDTHAASRGEGVLDQLHLTRETSPGLPRGMPSIPQTPLFLQSSNRSSRIPVCQDRKESGASLNSRSWTSGVMIAISCFFF